MKLTVLGNPDRYLAPLAGGSSYLLESAGHRVLLDAGQGARSALAARGVERLDAVWISHFHFDHCLDLPVLLGALPETAPLLFPAGERPRLDALAHAYVWEGPWNGGAPRGVEAQDAIELGPFRVTFARTRHSAPSMAARFEAEGASFVYASDTAPCDALVRLGRGADALLMHTLLPDVDPESDHARVHATARSAGSLAAEAGARELLLSHRYHGASSEDFTAGAGASMKGPEAVRLLRPGEEIVVRPGAGGPPAQLR